ncbi:DUF1642 domain-containing protein [Enterococcus hirae]|uniref:DUF1642 domain-containing protein n=1 Tax=Enterococcus hirae TaxID=1354 RepID=UPI0009BD9C9F|nr:DUF1642 domain-containing protein [Enterococcus hirae]EMF0247337.1 DUF1642 domain-containing protein [Enterococcus hirae]EMF0607401.1 DUF1642 domain-containing protein [Enterococcus hirae]OQO33620.1 hypothetical protein BH731_10870 [Enterococcus hirae]OQO39049.1 hypothetical protein BH738_01985 [Enterococcus hirae]
MNKQELIEELARHASCLEDFRGITGHCDGKYEAYEIAIELAKKLDEPQKPVVPQFVGDWIELCKEKADLISCLSGSYEYGVDQYKRITEDEDWLFEADHQELVARAWLYGYEVEKEPLYEVIVGNLFLVKKFTDRNDISFVNKFELYWWEKSAYQLTEPEIKAIDERYWAFAVPLEEVTEG